jgi:hypothetical protein
MADPILVVTLIAAAAVLYFVYANACICSTQAYENPRNFNYVSDSYLEALPKTQGNPNFDQDVNSIDFANVVGSVDYTASAPATTSAGARFQKLHDSTKLPDTITYLNNYDVDVANPASYAYGARNPVVVLKDPLYAQADPFRGDIPIRRNDNVCLIEKSSHGRSSLRRSGMFNPEYDQMISDYVHNAEQTPYKNMPVAVAREGTIVGGQ